MFCKRKPPAYTLHKASGQAVVRLCGKDHYLGPCGTPSSHERYEQALLQWRNQVSPNTQSDTASSFGSSKTHELSIDEVLVAYWRFGETYYATADGQPTKELTSMRLALRPLRRLYGTTRASDFGPKALKLVREQMIADGLSRKVVNNRINRIRRFIQVGSRRRACRFGRALLPAGGEPTSLRSY